MASPFSIDTIDGRAPAAATDFVYVGRMTSILSVLLDEVIPGACLHPAFPGAAYLAPRAII